MMDFWSRLIGGSSSSATSPSRSPRRNAAAERHTAFKHIYNALYQTWRSSSSLSRPSPSIPRIRASLERLNALLSDESRSPSPHPCLSFAATSQVYLTIAKLALATNDTRIVLATAVFFNILIDAEVDGIVDSRAFSRALVDLVRRSPDVGSPPSSAASDADSESESRSESRRTRVDCEGKLVELIFGVANNIRLRPEILPAWFHPQQVTAIEESEMGREAGETFAGATRKEDFPLFYLLLDYVHCAGRKGDFARTGLLYIIDTASKSKDLERWLIESDMATLMATGLGGLYSQLGRILPPVHDAEIPPIVALSDDTRLEAFIRHDLGGNMDSFLSYLLFWQDAIDHCKSVELNDTLLDHFQVLFLEQLLYPSLLESSDVDGGSTPAVITYLSRILESIDQPELIHRILHFLLASPSEEASEKRKPAKKPKMSVSRRKSLDLLATFALAAAIPSPTLFNLVDLVSMSIKSHNNQTLVATLKLITIIVQQHHHFANALIKASPTSAETSCKLRTLGGLNAELQQLIGFATMIDDSPSLDRSYSSYLANASSVLAPRILSMGWNDSTGMSRLHVDDIIFRGMLDHLSHFFTNNVITNLALTSAIAALATSNLISLDGWLLVPPDKYQFTHSSDATTNSSDEDTFESSSANSQHQDTEQPLKSAYKQPLLSNASADLPALILVLRNLVDQLHAWREAIPDFNVLLAGRRDLLRVSDDGGGGGEHDAATEGQHSIEAANSGAGMAIDTEDSRGRRRNVLQGQGPRSGSGLSTVPSPGNPQHSTAMTVSGTVHSVPDFVSSSPARTSVSQSRSPSAAMGTAVMSTAATYIPIDLHRRLANTLSTELGQSRPSPVGKESHSDPTSTGSDDDENGSATSTSVNGKDITLGHVLTNVVILYEFVLELAALVQMRASIFAEVGFY